MRISFLNLVDTLSTRTKNDSMQKVAVFNYIIKCSITNYRNRIYFSLTEQYIEYTRRCDNTLHSTDGE